MGACTCPGPRTEWPDVIRPKTTCTVHDPKEEK